MALSQAVAEAEWLQVLLRDVLHHDVDGSDWRRSLSPFCSLLRGNSALAAGRQPQAHLVDAKSVFDTVFKEAPGSRQDRRSAIELAIVVEALQAASGRIRWIPHAKMPADAMTHEDIARTNFALLDLLKTGALSLVDENSEMEARSRQPGRKSRTARTSKQQLQEEAAEDI